MEKFLNLLGNKEALKLEMLKSTRELTILMNNENHEYLDVGYRLLAAKKRALVLLAIHGYELGNNDFKSIYDAVKVYQNVL